MSTSDEIVKIMNKNGFWDKKNCNQFIKYISNPPKNVNFPFSYVKDFMQFVDKKLAKRIVNEPWFKFDVSCIEELSLNKDRWQIICYLLQNISKTDESKKKKLDRWWILLRKTKDEEEKELLSEVMVAVMDKFFSFTKLNKEHLNLIYQYIGGEFVLFKTLFRQLKTKQQQQSIKVEVEEVKKNKKIDEIDFDFLLENSSF